MGERMIALETSPPKRTSTLSTYELLPPRWNMRTRGKTATIDNSGVQCMSFGREGGVRLQLPELFSPDAGQH